jgi:hypothetical protein
MFVVGGASVVTVPRVMRVSTCSDICRWLRHEVRTCIRSVVMVVRVRIHVSGQAYRGTT